MDFLEFTENSAKNRVRDRNALVIREGQRNRAARKDTVTHLL